MTLNPSPEVHYVSVLGGKGELCNRDRWIDGPLIARLGAGPLKMHLASVLKVATSVWLVALSWRLDSITGP